MKFVSVGISSCVYAADELYVNGETDTLESSLDSVYAVGGGGTSRLFGSGIYALSSDGLERIDGELIYATCLNAFGIMKRIAVDRGTLALREHSYLLENGDLMPYETVSYDETPPDTSFLDSWEAPLRTVTVHWESFENEAREAHTDLVRLPADWEYLPLEVQFGGYHCWMDEGYTQPYAYPGDGLDYELYLTTAVG